MKNRREQMKQVGKKKFDFKKGETTMRNKGKIKIAEQVASGIFNAFAFAGASYIFSRFNNSGYTEEMHRHNLAMEKFTKDHDQWNQARLNEIDRVQKLHSDQREAEKDREETLNDFVKYARLQESKQKKYDFDSVDKIFKKTEPKFKNYYKPSNEMQKYITWVKYAGSFFLSSAIVFAVL